jgi:putative membrane protein insertion efficiency factor
VNAVRTIATAPVRFYQRAISPAIPARCKYHPSCSEYAVQAVRRYGVLRGVVLAAWRLLRCNPWSHGGAGVPDEPPEAVLPDYLRDPDAKPQQ